MFNKLKDQLNEKFKKKNEDVVAPETVSDTQSNQSAPNTQAQQVAFSLNNMGEFSHEELQQVIRKYDSGLQRLRTSI